MGISINGGAPIAGWFLLGKIPFKTDDVGNPMKWSDHLTGLWVVIQGLLDSYRTVLWVGRDFSEKCISVDDTGFDVIGYDMICDI